LDEEDVDVVLFEEPEAESVTAAQALALVEEITDDGLDAAALALEEATAEAEADEAAVVVVGVDAPGDGQGGAGGRGRESQCTGILSAGLRFQLWSSQLKHVPRCWFEMVLKSFSEVVLDAHCCCAWVAGVRKCRTRISQAV
jgi:hypothetical protein